MEHTLTPPKPLQPMFGRGQLERAWEGYRLGCVMASGSLLSGVVAPRRDEAVQVLLGDDTEKFMHRYMNDCQRTRYCDVTTAPWPQGLSDFMG